MAKAAATSAAVAMRSGEKKNSVARPAWNIPSPHWETSRTLNSLRKSRCTATTRRSPSCLLYTSDAADEEDSVDLGGRRIIKKKKKKKKNKKKKHTNRKN